MSQIFDGIFEKFLPGWKVRIAAIMVALLGVSLEQPGMLHQLGIDAPSWVYAIMYALGLLGGGEKINQLVKSNALMAMIEKSDTPARTLERIEEAKPGSTTLPGEKPPEVDKP